MKMAGFRPLAETVARREWMEPFAWGIDATKPYVVSTTPCRVDWNAFRNCSRQILQNEACLVKLWNHRECGRRECPSLQVAQGCRVHFSSYARVLGDLDIQGDRPTVKRIPAAEGGVRLTVRIPLSRIDGQSLGSSIPTSSMGKLTIVHSSPGDCR
jgi:hypothetical protein